MSMTSIQTLLRTLLRATLLASLLVAPAARAQGGSSNSTTTLDALSPAGTVAYGSTRTYSGTVTPAAVTGDVQVLAGTTVICTATLVGTTSKTYSCTSASIPNAGTYNITGKYLGNATYKLSTSAARSQTIGKISPSSVTLTSSSATPTQGSAFTLTAMVTVPAGTTPTGTVNFRTSANASLSGCGAVALTGTGVTKTATCSVTETTAGSKTYNASYSGDVNFTAGTNPTVSVTIKGTTTTTLNALSPTGSVAYAVTRTYSGTVTPAEATGSVQVLAGSTLICGATLTGTSSKTFSCTSASTPNAGSYSITAQYQGDSGYVSSTSAARTQTITPINPGSVTLASSSATPATSTAFTLTATVTVPAGTTPTGSINFRTSANASLTGCSAVALTGSGTSKTATCSVTETITGSKTYNALYSGDVNFTAGTNPTVSVTVISNVPANNNTGNNSAADPVLIDVYYVHPDHLGTPRAVTNPTTNLKVWEWEFTPFGETLTNENPQNLTGAAFTTGQFRYNLRFPGQVFDAESGKHYNYFRDYDPGIGRYTESDPIGLRGGTNTFGYVLQAPTKFVDKRGLLAISPIDPGGPGWPSFPGYENPNSGCGFFSKGRGKCLAMCMLENAGVCMALGIGTGTITAAIYAGAIGCFAPPLALPTFILVEAGVSLSASMACSKILRERCFKQCPDQCEKD